MEEGARKRKRMLCIQIKNLSDAHEVLWGWTEPYNKLNTYQTTWFGFYGVRRVEAVRDELFKQKYFPYLHSRWKVVVFQLYKLPAIHGRITGSNRHRRKCLKTSGFMEVALGVCQGDVLLHLGRWSNTTWGTGTLNKLRGRGGDGGCLPPFSSRKQCSDAFSQQLRLLCGYLSGKLCCMFSSRDGHYVDQGPTDTGDYYLSYCFSCVQAVVC